MEKSKDEDTKKVDLDKYMLEVRFYRKYFYDYEEEIDVNRLGLSSHS